MTTTISKNRFGCLVEETVYPYPHTQKTIKAPLIPFHMDYVQMENHIVNYTKRHQEFKVNGVQPVATCGDRAPEQDPSDFLMLLPVFAAEVSAKNPKMTY